MNKKNLRKGFTTVELVIVIAVIAILATALIPTFGSLIEKANESADARTAENIYKNYIAEDPVNRAGASYFIEVKGKIFAVDAGSLNTDATVDVGTIPCNAKIITTDCADSAIKGANHVDDNGDSKCDFGGEAYTAS